MKNFVAVILILFCSMLCSCTTDTSGYSYELTSSKWGAELDGGAEVTLEFTGENACFAVSNADKNTEIKGKYIVDESTFVIFVPEISTNYGFSYVPKGNTLDLKYNGNTITLERRDAAIN